MINQIDRYIARLIFTPLVATLLVSAMLLLLDKMLKLFDFVMNEGGPVTVVWQMLGNLIPQYLSLGIPIGLMLGIVLTFRKLATSSEFDAIASAGISHLRLLRVPLLYSVGLALITLWIVGFIQPYSRYAYEGLRFDLRSGARGASIKVGEFAHLGKRLTLRIEQSQNSGRDLMGIFAHATSEDGATLAVSADRGTFLATDDPDVILFRLYNGILVHQSPKQEQPRLLRFEQHDLPVDLPRMEIFRARGGRELELTMPELLALRQDTGQDAAARSQAWSNFHRRMIQVAVLFVIPFLGMALAIPPKRQSSALGVFAGVVSLVVYNEVSEFCERLGADGVADAALLQWGTFSVFVVSSLWLFYLVGHRVGDPPIGYLIRLGDRMAKIALKLIPKRGRDWLAAG